jgi:similar to spore coat protein
MTGQGLALHETLELHELMTSKTVCLLEAKARVQLAQDPALKTMLQQDIQNTTQAVTEMQGHLANCQI